MIGKISKSGKSFRGILDYAAGHGTLIGGNMAGENARQLAKEFGISRNLMPGRKQPVFHCAISLPPGESLTDEQFTKLAKNYLDSMGYQRSQYAIFRHSDKAHQHVHIIASRITLEGTWVKDGNEHRRSEKICRELEIKYNLQRVNEGREKPKRKALSKEEIESAIRTDTIPKRQIIADAIDAELGGQPLTFAQFSERLAERGITAKLNTQSTGRIYGTSFSIDGIAFPGGKIGNNYTLGNLKQRGLIIMNNVNKIELTTFATMEKAAAAEIQEPTIQAKNIESPAVKKFREEGKAILQKALAAADNALKSTASDGRKIQNIQKRKDSAGGYLRLQKMSVRLQKMNDDIDYALKNSPGTARQHLDQQTEFMKKIREAEEPEKVFARIMDEIKSMGRGMSR